MTRGSGVRLQRYKDGGLSDVKTFKGAEGLTWTDGAGRAFSLTLKELVRLARQPRRCRPARAEGISRAATSSAEAPRTSSSPNRGLSAGCTSERS